MMQLKQLATAALILFSVCCVQAAEYSLSQASDSKKSFLTASYENSSFKLTDGEIKGAGVKIDFAYFFAQKINLEMALSTALNAQSTGQASFTGIEGYLYYTVWGESYDTLRTVSLNQQTVFVDRNQKINSLQIGAGVDQYLLNGSKSVYSASGLGAGVVYRFNLFNYNFKAGVRSSTMTAGAQKMQGLFYSLGLVFTL